MEKGTSPKGRRGCLVVLVLALLLLVTVALFVAWQMRFIKIGGMEPISRSAAALREAPVDPQASEAVTKALAKAGVAGVRSAVLSLPEKEGAVAILVIDPAAGFKPATGPEGKRKQARAAIKQLVQANLDGKLNLERVGLEYQENGKAWVAVTAPMSALRDLDAGKITEEQFLARVDVKIQDPQVLQDLLKRFR